MQFLNQHTSKYCEYLAQSFNNKLQVDMIIMDFSKAFDTVPHNRLLNKLNRYSMAFVTKLTIGFLTFSNIVNKGPRL